MRTQADYSELQLYGEEYSNITSNVPGSLYQFLIVLTVIHLHFTQLYITLYYNHFQTIRH